MQKRFAGIYRSMWGLSALVPVAIFAVMIWHRRWTADDGFINIRIVANLLAGDGPVYNAGERVEAYTSTLWMGIIALLGKLGIGLEMGAMWAALFLSLAGIVLAQLGAVTLAGSVFKGTEAENTENAQKDSILGRISWKKMLPAGVMTYVALPVAWDFGTSALETGLSLTWLGLCFFLVARMVDSYSQDSEKRGFLPYGTAIVLGLGPLVRPELALFSFGFLVPLLWAVFGKRGVAKRGLKLASKLWMLVKLGVAMGTIPVGYQIFRMGYFAAIVPNTAIAKSAFGSNWKQGWHYVEHFYGLYWLAIPLFLILFFLAKLIVENVRERDYLRLVAYLVPVVCGLGHSVYVIKVGGDFMHGRLFLPALFGMLLPVASVSIGDVSSRKITQIVGGLAVVGIFAWAGYCGAQIRISETNYEGIGDERGWYARQAKHLNPVTLEDYDKMFFLDEARKVLDNGAYKYCPTAFGREGGNCEPVVYVTPDSGRLRPERAAYPLRADLVERGFVLAVMRIGIGMQSLLFGPKIYVVDQVGLADPVSSRLVLTKRKRPGHEKFLPVYWYVARFSEPTVGEDPQITVARKALGCGDLAELQRAVEGELTWSRFVKNIRLAYPFHKMQVDPDPAKAVLQFCGDDGGVE